MSLIVSGPAWGLLMLLFRRCRVLWPSVETGPSCSSVRTALFCITAPWWWDLKFPIEDGAKGPADASKGNARKPPGSRPLIRHRYLLQHPNPPGVWLSPFSVRWHIPFKSPLGIKCTLQLQQSHYPHHCRVSPAPLKCVTVQIRGKPPSLGSCWAPPSPSHFGRGHQGWAQLREQSPAKCQRQGRERCCEVGAASTKLSVIFTSPTCISRQKTFTVT